MPRQVIVGTAWAIVCFAFLCMQPAYWPLTIFLCATRWLVFIDEGHEARLLERELQSWLT